MNQPDRTTPRRLGRGLASLLSTPVAAAPATAAATPLPPPTASWPNATPPPPPTGTGDNPVPPAPTDPAIPHAILLKPADIRPNPHQPRREMDPAKLRELAGSIATTGLIQPIVVRQTPAGYELIAGERRLRATQLAGLETIPAWVRQVDSITQAQMALIENIQREDLNPIERALAYKHLTGAMGLSQVELGTRLGEDRSVISNHLRLLELPQAVRDHIAAGRLSLGHAKLLGAVATDADRIRLAELCIHQNLTVRNLEKMIAAAPAVQRPGPNRPTAHLQDLEKQITRQLGLRAQVQRRPQGKGKLILHYSSLDEFDTLMEKLNVNVE